MTRFTKTLTGLCFLSSAAIGSHANAQQIFYEFSSGPDGVSWPASPTGLLDSDAFFTPDGLDIYNETGNNLFFDQQYQVVGNGSRISGDAMWGNPLDFGGGYLGLDFYNINGGGVQQVDFDFAWSEAGVPAVYDFLEFYVYDSDGRSSFGGWSLSDTFTGFGGSTGYEDHISLDASMFTDDEFNLDGGAFIDISYLEIFVYEITFGGNSSEFAIDNLATDGAGGPGGNGEVFPSVNGGQFDVTGSTNGTSALRGTGTAGIGLEVTNDSGNNTTYSIQLQPGGDLSAGTVVFGDAILDGESIFTSNVATVDRSLPAGEYASDVVTINNGDPLDPDNTSTLEITLLDAPLLSGTAGTVNVSAAQTATLSNAAGPFRASVKFDPGTSTTTGPFTLVSDFDDVRVLPGGSASATLGFDRFGQLSGTRTGTLTTSVIMTNYIVNGQVDFESFLGFAEPVPDQTWNLSYNHTNTTTDNANISTGASYHHLLGVNTFDVAATLIDGESSKNQNVSMQITPNPDPGSGDLIGDAVDLIFGGGAGDIYVLQLTYDEAGVPVGSNESDLELGWFNELTGEWESAVAGNSGGTPTFFNGAYSDYLGTLGGGVLDTGDLGVYGYDLFNNHVWAILDHASLFGVGVLGAVALPGDLDGDGFVGINDLNIVLANWNQNVPPANPLADPSGDGFVGIDDLNAVLGNWNAGTPPNSNAVPEPASIALLTMGVFVFTRRTRQ